MGLAGLTMLRHRSTAAIACGALALAGLAASAQLTAAAHTPDTAHGHAVMLLHMHLAREYPSWGHLKGASALIVLGAASAQHTETPTGVGDIPWTTTTVQVERSLSAAAAAPQTVLIRQAGGVDTNGVPSKSVDFPLLTSGDRYLLFLTPSPIAGQYYTVGAPQGVFRIDPDGLANSFTDEAAQIGVSVHGLPLDRLISAVQAAPAVSAAP